MKIWRGIDLDVVRLLPEHRVEHEEQYATGSGSGGGTGGDD